MYDAASLEIFTFAYRKRSIPLNRLTHWEVLRASGEFRRGLFSQNPDASGVLQLMPFSS